MAAAIDAGAGHRVEFIGRVAVQLSLCVSVPLLLTLMIAPVGVAAVVLGDAAAPGVAAAAVLLPSAACLLVLEGVQSALGGALSGMRDARGPLLMAVLGAWCLGLPLGAVLAWTGDAPAQGLWAGLVGGGGVTTVLYGTRFRNRAKTCDVTGR